MGGNTLIDALAATARADPGRPWLIRPGGAAVRDHDALFDDAARMAGALAAAGLAPGDRVAAQVEKSPEALVLYLATVMAGGVLVPLNPAYTEAEMAWFLADADPALLVCDPARADGLAPLAGAARTLTLDAAGQGSLIRAAAAAAPADPAPRGAEDLAAILYTSGTTGRPKGAMLSHRALASNSATLTRAWGFGPADRLIHALPVFHTHGLFVATNVALMAGAALIFLPRFEPGAVLDAMAGGATALMGVPTFYTRLLDDPRLTAATCAGMRLFVSGSAPLPAAVHAAWQARTGHAILERYGMTETNMNTSNPLDGPRRPGTVGPPLPEVALRIADPETGAEMPRGETGMVELRGPNLFSGYWNRPDKTAEEMRPGGWFVTGDLGRIDPDGYLTIAGRAKDLIISGGFNIYPAEVEAALDALDGVRESAVFGVPHPDLGEAAVAAIVPDGAAPDMAATVAALDGRLARFKQPRRLVAVEALPRNAMGKVQKAALRDRFAGLFDD